MLKVNNDFNIYVSYINFIRSIIIIPFSVLFIIRNILIIYLVIKNFYSWYVKSNSVWDLMSIRLGIARIITATSSIFFGIITGTIASDIIIENTTGTRFLERIGRKYRWREDYKDINIRASSSTEKNNKIF